MRLFAGLLPRRPHVLSRSVPVRFKVDTMILYRVFPPIFRFLLSVSFQQSSTRVVIYLQHISEGQAEKSWKLSYNWTYFHYSLCIVQNGPFKVLNSSAIAVMPFCADERASVFTDHEYIRLMLSEQFYMYSTFKRNLVLWVALNNVSRP